MAAMILGALLLDRSFRLTALSDWIQSLLLLSGTLSFVPRAIKSQGRSRLFWALMATGMAFWFFYQLMWTYFEVWLRQDVPDLCAGDIVLFLHIVPFMAALALRPHGVQDEYSARLRRLDFTLMMVWWMYLYVFAVMAWQYVVPNVTAYDNDLNLLYLIEKIAFLSGLLVAWLNSTGGWKVFYANLFGASLMYAGSSYLANWAIGHHAYYSGSLYDIPLTASMTWISVIGLWPEKKEETAPIRHSTSTSQSVWLARLGMVTVFSLPLFAAGALLEPNIPLRIRSFRLVLTLGAALLMGVMIFVRQRLLDRELFRLLTQSQESFAHLKLLQAQITESEKLASIGQLVGGAAHELNNPIAAMLGYSDLLAGSSLTPEQKELAAKIGQQVRRTRSLVASLLSFARQRPVTMATVDLKMIVRTAVRLSEPVATALKIDVRVQLPADLPPVLGDSNQLLQVCAQVLNNVLNAAEQRGARTLIVLAESCAGMAKISMSEMGILDLSAETDLKDHKMNGEARSGELENDPPLSGLGLTACQGILQQHRGKISWQRGSRKEVMACIELPLIPQAPEKPAVAGVPVMWQPESFA
jgi:signal transduction histidine kinase